jgi:hypothetical protein
VRKRAGFSTCGDVEGQNSERETALVVHLTAVQVLGLSTCGRRDGVENPLTVKGWRPGWLQNVNLGVSDGREGSKQARCRKLILE